MNFLSFGKLRLDFCSSRSPTKVFTDIDRPANLSGLIPSSNVPSSFQEYQSKVYWPLAPTHRQIGFLRGSYLGSNPTFSDVLAFQHLALALRFIRVFSQGSTARTVTIFRRIAASPQLHSYTRTICALEILVPIVLSDTAIPASMMEDIVKHSMVLTVLLLPPPC